MWQLQGEARLGRTARTHKQSRQQTGRAARLSQQPVSHRDKRHHPHAPAVHPYGDSGADWYVVAIGHQHEGASADKNVRRERRSEGFRRPHTGDITTPYHDAFPITPNLRPSPHSTPFPTQSQWRQPVETQNLASHKQRTQFPSAYSHQ